MIHFNPGSHDGRTIDELTAMVEASESSAGALSEAHRGYATGNVPTASLDEVLSGNPQIHLPVAASPESERVLLASAPTQSQPLSEPAYPYACHGAAQAHDAGVETFQGQFGGEEI